MDARTAVRHLDVSPLLVVNHSKPYQSLAVGGLLVVLVAATLVSVLGGEE